MSMYMAESGNLIIAELQFGINKSVTRCLTCGKVSYYEYFSQKAHRILNIVIDHYKETHKEEYALITLLGRDNTKFSSPANIEDFTEDV